MNFKMNLAAPPLHVQIDNSQNKNSPKYACLSSKQLRVLNRKYLSVNSLESSSKFSPILNLKKSHSSLHLDQKYYKNELLVTKSYNSGGKSHHLIPNVLNPNKSNIRSIKG